MIYNRAVKQKGIINKLAFVMYLFTEYAFRIITKRVHKTRKRIGVEYIYPPHGHDYTLFILLFKNQTLKSNYQKSVISNLIKLRYFSN